MPTSQTRASDEPIATSVACPQLLTPPPELDVAIEQDRAIVDEAEATEDGEMRDGAGDNTAHGMAYEQQMSMYASPEDDGTPPAQNEGDKEKAPAAGIEGSEANELVVVQRQRDTGSQVELVEGCPPIPRSTRADRVAISTEDPVPEAQDEPKATATDRSWDEDTASSSAETSSQSKPSSPATQLSDKHICSPSSNPYPSTPHWDFSRAPLTPNQPSSLLRPGSRFSGTQQSDRQIYNVDVTLLTVDTMQSSLTGYLRICGLTEDNPTLTTFFSGEIIGGPSHRYTFRTRTPAWGATDRTDLIHWARFPAWRALAKEAKRDIDFAYPLDGGEWWQQENVYMRWKEHFLVPDHRVRSIAGASFEGFYYATFNQLEGKVSGIYFHAQSERYQQLELKHVFDKGVCPSREFR